LTLNGKSIDDEFITLLKQRKKKLKYTPRDNFYGYINQMWIDNVNKNASRKKTFYTKQDDIRIMQEDTISSLLKVLKMNATQKKVFDSFKRLDSSYITKHIQTLDHSLKNIFARNDFYELMAFMHKNPLFSSSFPLVWVMAENLKNSKYYCSTIYPASLTLFDNMYYFPISSKDPKSKYQKKLLEHYKKYVSEIMHLSASPFNVDDIFDCEIHLIECFSGNMVESPDGYNKITISQSIEQFGFDWNAFTRQMGFKTPSYFITTSTNYLANAMELMKEWNSPKWHSYWYYICLKQLIKFGKKSSKIDYEFNGKFINGVEKPFPDDFRGFVGFSYCYNTYLSKEFSKHFRDESIILYATNLLNELHKTFIHIVDRNKWLTPQTKVHAMRKIKHLTFNIGGIEHREPDATLPYNDDAWNNLSLQYTYLLIKLMASTDKPYIIDNREIDWHSYPPKFAGNQNYIVNAYYIPTQNSIFIPLGMLQEPFVVPQQSLEYNLSTIGYTVSHEMSHSLDNTGSLYDYKGNLKNWWLPSDRMKFDKFVKDVIKQYEVFAKYDGIIWDATNSAGEDIADISGLFILEEYLRNKLILNNEMLEVNVLKLKTFFSYFAQQNRQNIYKKAIPSMLITNPHPLNKYRANCPLARVKLFQSIYNIQPKDKMFWPDTNKLW
jgi:putative endopeptidase